MMRNRTWSGGDLSTVDQEDDDSALRTSTLSRISSKKEKQEPQNIIPDNSIQWNTRTKSSSESNIMTTETRSQTEEAGGSKGFPNNGGVIDFLLWHALNLCVAVTFGKSSSTLLNQSPRDAAVGKEKKAQAEKQVRKQMKENVMQKVEPRPDSRLRSKVENEGEIRYVDDNSDEYENFWNISRKSPVPKTAITAPQHYQHAYTPGYKLQPDTAQSSCESENQCYDFSTNQNYAYETTYKERKEPGTEWSSSNKSSTVLSNYFSATSSSGSEENAILPPVTTLIDPMEGRPMVGSSKYVNDYSLPKPSASKAVKTFADYSQHRKISSSSYDEVLLREKARSAYRRSEVGNVAPLSPTGVSPRLWRREIR